MFSSIFLLLVPDYLINQVIVNLPAGSRQLSGQSKYYFKLFGVIGLVNPFHITALMSIFTYHAVHHIDTSKLRRRVNCYKIDNIKGHVMLKELFAVFAHFT